MSNVYRIHGARFLRKYTAAEKSSNYAYMADVRKIADTLCKVPWTRVSGDVAATTTIHTEEGLDWNEPERDRFDAAEWCGEHADGFHRAFAQAACYVFKLPASAVGKAIEKIRVNVTSDPYNPYGARIAAMTSATLEIPMDCQTVREGEVFRAPDEDGMGAAPRLYRTNQDGTQTWYANSEIVELEPGSTLTAKQYLFVFVALENYNRGRDGWIEGSSYIDNDVELTLSAAASDLIDGELNDLAPSVVLSEFNVCRGGVLPPLVGEVSGVQALDVSLDGVELIDQDDMFVDENNIITLGEDSAIGLRVMYGCFNKGQMNQIGKSQYGLDSCVRPGVAYSLNVRRCFDSLFERLIVVGSNVTTGNFNAIAFRDGVFVASGNGTGLKYSTDGGMTWNNSNVTTGGFNAIAFGDGVFVAGGSGTGLKYSTDGGRTWNNCIKGIPSSSIAFGNGVFVSVTKRTGTLKNVAYSTDGGITWTIVEKSFESVGYSNGRFFASGYFTGAKYSDDCGATWNDSNISTGDVSVVSVNNVAFAFGYSTLYQNDYFGIKYSTDGGRTWNNSNVTTGDFRVIAFGDGVFVAGGNGTGLKYSTDGGRTWNNGNVTTGNFNAIAFGDGVFVAGGSGTGLKYSTDGGRTWNNGNLTTGNFNAIAFGDDTFVEGSDVGLFRSIPSAKECWKLMTSVLFVRTSIPIDFNAKRIRLDWNGWSGTSTPGAKFNVWMKSGEFASEYDENIVKNNLIYTAQAKEVSGYRLLGVIDATDQSRSATFDIPNLDGNVATILLTAYISMDDVNPSSEMQLPVGAANGIYVDRVNKRVIGIENSWRPDITLLG